jgi:hypothetical protein
VWRKLNHSPRHGIFKQAITVSPFIINSKKMKDFQDCICTFQGALSHFFNSTTRPMCLTFTFGRIKHTRQSLFDMRINLTLFFQLLLLIGLSAQSTVFVFQGGPTLGTQRWNGFDNGALLQWHGALSIESMNNDDDRSSVFAQLGYHVKGSSQRFFVQNLGSGNFFQQRDRFKFNNVSLILGAKMRKPIGPPDQGLRYYYFIGLRGDYTVSTNLASLREQYQVGAAIYNIYPFEGAVRRWIGGASLGGGIEFKLSDLVGGELKLSLHPDFTLQYRQPAIANVITGGQPGLPTTIGERNIRNTALELGVGLRLLRKVEYIDE